MPPTTPFVIALLLLCSLAPFTAAAQETDTEKAAAREVIRKMGDLERSVGIPALVARLTGPD
jgi:hypothetical protein